MFAKSKMEGRLCDTPITGEYIAEQFRIALGPKALLKSITSSKRIAVGQGFVSNILELKLVWECTRTDDLPETVIVKVPTVESLKQLMSSLVNGEGDQMKAIMAQVVATVHNVECDVYHLFGCDPPVLMPKYYVALPVTDEAPGMIILEDLRSKGASPPSFIRGMTHGQISSAVTELARLHAWSLTTPAKWRDKIPRTEEREQLSRGLLAPTAAGLKMVKETYPTEFGQIDLDKLTSVLTYEKFYEFLIAHRQHMDDVMIHGDFHMNNMLFERKSDGSVGDKLVALLDFQAVMQCSPAYDIARLMNVSVSAEVRRKHERDILQKYYDEVKSIARDKFNMTFDQFCQLYDNIFAFTALTMVAGIPTLNRIMIKSEGEQRTKEEKIILGRVKSFYDDGMKILGLE